MADHDNRPWNRQPWDTPVGYDRFLTYYLPLMPPRTIDKAYRAWRSSNGKPMADTNVRAPNHWWWWANGKDHSGKIIRDSYLDFQTWQDRGHAWDDYQAVQKIAQMEQERQQQRDRLQALARGAFSKLIIAWNKFDPERDDIKLGELVHATRIITDELRKAYDLELPQKVHIIDWRSEIVQLIKDGIVTLDDVKEELGDELAQELFVAAGALGIKNRADQETGL